jgi:hypothetical protein
MAGGKGKIHEHPNAGKNDFSKRPKEAGRHKLIDLKEAIFEEIGDEGIRKVLIALFKKAIKGDVRAIQELLDRGYYKPQQQVDHTTNGKDINITPIQWASEQK